MQPIQKSYVVTTTGALPKFGISGAFATYGLQVKGTGAAAGAWSVTLDGSLDGLNWTTLITHAATDGSTQWETTGKPCSSVRVNVASLTLSPATDIHIEAIAAP